MSYASKTGNIGLPQWASAEKPTMLDFNAAFLAVDAQAFGWMPLLPLCSYASADAPSFTVIIPGDVTGRIYPRVKVKLTQTTTKFFIVTASSYTAPNTKVTLYGGTDYVLTNAAISNVSTSIAAAPQGFPQNPTKWAIIVSNSNNVRLGTNGVMTGWAQYNTGVSYTVPIGAWNLSYFCEFKINTAAATTQSLLTELSTSPTAFVDSGLRCALTIGNLVYASLHSAKSKNVILAEKTTYYVLATSGNTTADAYLAGGEESTILCAVCAYL